MASIFKRKGKRTKHHPYIIQYKDEQGRKRQVTGYTDKDATLRRASDIEDRVRKIHDGLLDPSTERRQEHSRRPIGEHLEEFRQDMLARNVTLAQARLVHYRAERLFSLASIERLTDISPSAVMRAVARIQAEGRSAKTCNDTLAAAKQFCKWAKADKRLSENSIEHLKGYNKALDRRHDRRALSDDELLRLFRAAEEGPVRQGMTGPERCLIYRLAVLSGLRKSEIASLTLESFHLDGQTPKVVVDAAFSKHRKKDEQPIPEDIVPAMREWLSTKTPKEKVFHFPTQNHYFVALQSDLKAAGISYSTSQGYADFHALRHTYVTRLLRSGASTKIVQTLARHSDPRLTLNVYGHVELVDQTRALQALPSLAVRDVESDQSEEVARATGTGDQQIAQQISSKCVAFPGAERLEGAAERSSESKVKSKQSSGLGAESHGKSASGTIVKMAAPTGLEPVSQP